MQVHTIGIDIAKNVFQVHGVDEREEVILTRQLRRKQVIPFFDCPSSEFSGRLSF